MAADKWHNKDQHHADTIQKMARQEILSRTMTYNLEFRVRKKMQRWRFNGSDAIVASRVIQNLQIIGKRCRPCVIGSFFKTFWNGWPTTWRMRSAPNASEVRSCVMGCSPSAVDKIEHYLICPVAWNVLQTHWRIQLNPSRRSVQGMLLAEKGLDETEMALIAVSVYAIARTVQALRARHDCEAAPLLKLYIEEGRRGLRHSVVAVRQPRSLW